MNRTLVNIITNKCLKKMIAGEDVSLNMITTTLQEYQKEHKIFLSVVEEENIISDVCTAIYSE